MNEGPPFFGNAILALYRQDADGGWLADEAVALGTCHEGLSVREGQAAEHVVATGSRRPRRTRRPDRVDVELAGAWVFGVGVPALRPHHRQRYVLSVTWHRPENRSWLQQVFWGAEVDERMLRASGPHASERTLRFSADEMTERDGYGGDSMLAQGREQSVVSLMARETRLGDRLVGEYRWSGACRITGARFHATGASSVRLYIGEEATGVLVQNSGTWTGDVSVPALSSVHWRVEAHEGAGGAGYVGGVTLNVLVDPPTDFDVSDLRARLVAWVESEAFTQMTREHGLNGVLTGASVQWPDGAAGELVVTQTSPQFLAVDAFHVTFVRSGLPSYRITQPAVTRNAQGDVTVKPRPIIEEL